jgi:hypothetical protein
MLSPIPLPLQRLSRLLHPAGARLSLLRARGLNQHLTLNKESRNGHDPRHRPLRPLSAYFAGIDRLRHTDAVAALVPERLQPMTTIAITVRYAHYLLTAIGTIVFGTNMQ